MNEEERLTASRFEFTAQERTIWISHYPDEVPIVNNLRRHRNYADRRFDSAMKAASLGDFSAQHR
jgi:hypothetical protein